MAPRRTSGRKPAITLLAAPCSPRRSRKTGLSITPSTTVRTMTDQPTAHVRITLRDGRTLMASTTVVRGDAVDRVPESEVVAKFAALTAPVLGDAQARRVVEAVHEIETLKDVRDLGALLVPALRTPFRIQGGSS